MNQLSKNIDDACWRICTKLTAHDKSSGGILPYIQLHTAMLDFVAFERDAIRLEHGDETTVYYALCFMDEALILPVPISKSPKEWFGVTLHTLMRVLDAAHKPLGEGKEYIKRVSRMLDDSFDE